MAFYGAAAMLSLAAYNNIKDNVAKRIAAYMANQK